jgi:uncharacterized protein
MKEVFADTGYWIALVNPKDELRKVAAAASKRVTGCRVVTTEMVLTEFLNALGTWGEKFRHKAVQVVNRLIDDPNVVVVPQTSLQFRTALERFRERSDKDWSLTDCASFIEMENRGIGEALAHDRHYEQAGFTPLLRSE